MKRIAAGKILGSILVLGFLAWAPASLWADICNACPEGVKGTPRTIVKVYFEYSPEGDRQIEGDKIKTSIIKRISRLAKNNPTGPKFIYIETPPNATGDNWRLGRDYDLNLFFEIKSRGRNSEGKAQAYSVYLYSAYAPAGNSIGQFEFNTEFVEPEGNWINVLEKEAVDKWYHYIAHGWSCN